MQNKVKIEQKHTSKPRSKDVSCVALTPKFWSKIYFFFTCEYFEVLGPPDSPHPTFLTVSVKGLTWAETAAGPPDPDPGSAMEGVGVD